MTAYSIRSLDAGVDAASFRCGQVSLDEYIRRYASQSYDEPAGESGPWSQGTQAEAPAEPEQPKPNPWGRNPTGPRGRRS